MTIKERQILFDYYASLKTKADKGERALTQDERRGYEECEIAVRHNNLAVQSACQD